MTDSILFVEEVNDDFLDILLSSELRRIVIRPIPSSPSDIPIDIQPTGFITLQEECILEAVFRSHYYDAFDVLNAEPLKRAIEQISPRAASKMKANLHMTVAYPGKGKVPGLSEAYTMVFKKASSAFPSVFLHIREIYVTPDQQFGVAPVAAVDTAIPFMFNNNGTPAHLTLWGNPPVEAGRSLMGKSLNLRNPFIEVTDERAAACISAKLNQIQDLQTTVYSLNRDLSKVRCHITVLENVMKRRVTILQGAVRRWMARLRRSRICRLRRLTPGQRVALTKFILRWIESYKEKRYVHFNDYYDYDDYYGW